MKRFITSAVCLLVLGSAAAQETETTESDTTRINIGKRQVIIVLDEDGVSLDTVKKKPSVEAHWAGIEFGPTVLMNSAGATSFPDNKQWENDPAKSFSWNFNVLEHKFRIYRNNIGITTGIGFNITGVGLKQNVLSYQNDSLTVFVDTVNNFSKNKLRATYLTVPLMFEFCSNADGDDNGFYLAAGVIGGIRIGSSVKTKMTIDGRDTKEKTRASYGLEAFRVDAAVKLGYGNWGVFANYALTPLFDTAKTDAVYPLTFGLSYNF